MESWFAYEEGQWSPSQYSPGDPYFSADPPPLPQAPQLSFQISGLVVDRVEFDRKTDYFQIEGYVQAMYQQTNQSPGVIDEVPDPTSFTASFSVNIAPSMLGKLLTTTAATNP
jgi:hypothetical protein